MKNNNLKYGEDVPECPYCRIVLQKFPSRKTKCKACEMEFYVIRKPGTEFYYIVDHKRKNKWKKEEDFYRTIEYLKQYYGFNDDTFIKAAHSESNNFQTATLKILRKAVEINRDNYKNNPHLYKHIARIENELGMDPLPLAIDYCESQLHGVQFRDTPFKLFAIIEATGTDKCKKCIHLNNLTMEVDEAKRINLIPHKDCDDKVCASRYNTTIMRDIFGQTIYK